ncbi:MAG: ABC transporter substrate-binding protein [Paraclostridium sp.]
MSFKKVIMSSMLALTLCLSTGCSSSKEEDGTIKLRYSIWDNSHKEAIETLIEDYEKENPNIDVSLEVYSWADYWTKLETSAAGGSAPDLFWITSGYFRQYAEADKLVDLEKYIKDSSMDMNNYIDTLVNMYNYKDVQYAIPTFWDVGTVLINEELVKEYGLEMPSKDWTWDEMIEWAEDAKTKLPEDVSPITSPLAGDLQIGFHNSVASSGGQIISDDGKKAMIDTPEVKAGIKKFFDLAKSDLHTDQNLVTEIGAGPLFRSNKALAAETITAYLGIYSDEEQSDVAGKFEVYPFPKMSDNNKNILSGLGNAISSNSKHPEEAWDFINYMSSENSMKKYSEIAMVPQAHKNVQEDYVKVVKDKQDLDVSIVPELATNAVPIPSTIETASWERVIITTLEEHLQGKISFDESINKMQAGVQDVLDKENK